MLKIHDVETNQIKINSTHIIESRSLSRDLVCLSVIATILDSPPRESLVLRRLKFEPMPMPEPEFENIFILLYQCGCIINNCDVEVKYMWMKCLRMGRLRSADDVYIVTEANKDR